MATIFLAFELAFPKDGFNQSENCTFPSNRQPLFRQNKIKQKKNKKY